MGKKTTLRLAGAVVACALTLGNASAFALSKGDWLFRVRGIDVIPNDSSSEITPPGGAAVKGSEVSVNSAATVEGDITYMATDSIGMELIVANTRHTITDNGVATGPKVLGLSSDIIGVTDVLPPTLLVQYHFMHAGKIRPYVGFGVNGTVFYDTKSGINGLGLKLDNSIGYAGQVGLDMDVTKHWFINLDLKYINLETKAKLINSSTGATAYTTNVKINPWVVGLGIGTTF